MTTGRSRECRKQSHRATWVYALSALEGIAEVCRGGERHLDTVLTHFALQSMRFFHAVWGSCHHAGNLLRRSRYPARTLGARYSTFQAWRRQGDRRALHVMKRQISASSTWQCRKWLASSARQSDRTGYINPEIHSRNGNGECTHEFRND